MERRAKEGCSALLLPSRRAHVRTASETRERTNLDCSGVSLNVDDISDDDSLLLDGLVDGGVESKLLGSLDGLESNDDVRDGLSVT